MESDYMRRFSESAHSALSSIGPEPVPSQEYMQALKDACGWCNGRRMDNVVHWILWPSEPGDRLVEFAECGTGENPDTKVYRVHENMGKEEELIEKGMAMYRDSIRAKLGLT